MDVTRAAGKLGIPGLYVTGDPGGIDKAAQEGSLSIRIGLGWASHIASRQANAQSCATTMA
jgi:glutathione-independent formaldehyde dehydrogenase